MRTISGAIIGAAFFALVQSAHAQTCQELWIERNQYYKDAGYCFKTARAIRYFGNTACQYSREDEVPLMPAVRARIAEIVRLERELGCD